MRRRIGNWEVACPEHGAGSSPVLVVGERAAWFGKSRLRAGKGVTRDDE